MSDSQVIALIASTPLSTNSHAYMQGLTHSLGVVLVLQIRLTYIVVRMAVIVCYLLIQWPRALLGSGGAYSTPEATFDI